MKNQIRLKIIMLIFLVAYIGISLYYLDKYPLFWVDESYYGDVSYTFLKQGTFGSTLSPPIGGLEKTNVVYGRIFLIFNALVFRFFDIGVRQIRIQQFFCGLIVLLLTYAVAQLLFANKVVSLASSLVLSLSHVFVLHSHFGRPEMTTTMFVLLTVFLFLYAEKKNSLVFYFLTGLFSSLAVDAHSPGVIAVFIVFALVLTKKFLFKSLNLEIFIAITTGISIGTIWWVIMHLLINLDIFFTQLHKFWYKWGETLPLLEKSYFGVFKELRRYYNFFVLGRYHRNLFLLLIFVMSIIYGIIRRKEKGYAVLLTSVLGCIIGLTFFVPNPTSFYIILFYPFLAILSINFLYHQINSTNYLRKIRGVIIGLCWFLLLSAENFYKVYYFHSADYYSFINKVKKFIPEGTNVIGSSTYWVGFKDQSYYTEFFLWHLTWTDDEIKNFLGRTFQEVLKKKNIEYIIKDDSFCWFLGGHSSSEIDSFLRNNCQLVGSVEDNFYGAGDYATVKMHKLRTEIYKVIKYSDDE